MVQSRLLILMLKPSWISLCTVVFVTAVVVGGANWSYFTYDASLYNIFYGDSGFVTALEQSPDIANAVQGGVVNNPLVYTLLVVFFALLAATAVFVAIREIKHGVGALRMLRLHTSADRLERLQHLKVRGIILGVWIIYALLTFSIALPFCLLVSRIGAEDFSTLGGAAMTAGGTLLFASLLHGHIIFARLFCLRPRIFGGHTAINDAFMR